jgi:cytochrome c-type biogenesis protein CcmH
MTLWFLFALMTVAAVFAVLWPLGRGGRPKGAGSEAAVYRDQLAEIDRDVAAGLIGAAEADTARVEISRRLLAAVDRPRDPAVASNIGLRRATAVIGLAGLPVMAVAVYLQLGSPRLADLSAIEAWRNAITHGGDSAERRAALGEAMTAVASGVVTPEARAEFERALALNADEFKASYFLGLSAEQNGRADEAASIWRGMLAKAPADAPWRPLVQEALLRVGGSSAPALSDDTMTAAKDMNETDRGAMIRGMVERLAGRLKQNGGNVEGWLRLVRAYLVMGDRDSARAALRDARLAVANDAERLRQLNEGVMALGLDG